MFLDKYHEKNIFVKIKIIRIKLGKITPTIFKITFVVEKGNLYKQIENKIKDQQLVNNDQGSFIALKTKIKV